MTSPQRPGGWRSRLASLREGEFDTARGALRFWWILPTMGIAAILGITIVAAGECGGAHADRQTLTEVLHEVVPLPSSATIEIRVDSGDVHVTPLARSGVVQLTVERSGTGVDASGALDELENLTIEVESSDHLVIRSRQNRPSMASRATVTVQAPPSANLIIDCRMGSVTVDDMEGTVHADASDDVVVSASRTSSFELTAMGRLVSDFPLNQTAAEPLYVATYGDADPRQKLELHSDNGVVKLRRQ